MSLPTFQDLSWGSSQLLVSARRSCRGAEVSFHDPHVAEITVSSTILTRSELTERHVAGADCVAILTPHQAYDMSWITEHAQLVFDARNASRGQDSKNLVRL